MKFNDTELGYIDTEKMTKEEIEARILRANPHYEEIIELEEYKKHIKDEGMIGKIDRLITSLKKL